MDGLRPVQSCRGGAILLCTIVVATWMATSILWGTFVEAKPVTPPSKKPSASTAKVKPKTRPKAPARVARKPVRRAARPAAAGPTWVGVTVNGKKAPFQAALLGGSTYIPMQAAADTFGARIEWDSATGAVAVNGTLLRAKPWRYRNVVYLPVGPLSRILRLQARYTASARSLSLGSGGVAVVSPTPPVGPRTTPTPPPVRTGPFVPREATDGVFNVTVTDLQQMDVIKGYYRPRPGEKFVMVSVSQQNVSNDLQIYTGRFVLLDDKGQAHDALENLSNFWLVILRPGGTNFGYLMYEMPVAARPSHLVLDTRERAPLQVPLL